MCKRYGAMEGDGGDLENKKTLMVVERIWGSRFSATSGKKKKKKKTFRGKTHKKT